MGKEILQENGILRFTPNISYSHGNFSKLREEHSKLQLDSVNCTRDRLNTILIRTNWPAEYFKDKLVLECGCGAGPDTEILLNFGAKVVSVDIDSVDICKANIGEHPNFFIFQASIDDLPFREKAFDIVFCHRVIHHTPSPAKTLDHILSFVKNDGAVFVESYARSINQMISWKYALRPISRRMNPDLLYKTVKAYIPALFKFTNFIRKIPPDLLGRIFFEIANHFIPIRNYRFASQFSNKSDEFIMEYAIHDTFDCLSPRYDYPLCARRFREIAKKHLHNSFEIVGSSPIWAGSTILRTRLTD